MFDFSLDIRICVRYNLKYRTDVPNGAFDMEVYMNTNGRRKYINYRKRQQIFRTCCLIISLFVLSVCFAFGASRLVSNAQSNSDITYFKYHTSITIAAGDTLTSLAKEYGEHFDSYEDFINEVKFSNHLNDDTIYAGMNLIIPYYSTEFK